MKKDMKKVSIKTTIILFLFLGCLKGFSQTKNFIDQPYLETTSKVDSLVIPDRIYLSIAIAEIDTKGKVSVEKLENMMEAKLQSLNIDVQKQLSLADMSSNFNRYFLRKTDVQKSKEYILLVYDAQTAGKAIQGLESIGIANVSLLKSEYSKIDKLKNILRQQAVKKAKEQAEMMLMPLDQKVGKALFISDLNTSVYNNFQGKVSGVRMSMEADNYEPIPIDFEKIRVESAITIRFAILE